MYTKQPKKLIIMNILDVLRKYTDEDHRLSQKEIADILKTEYEMTVDRKAIKRNLMNLIDFGYELEYSETIRMTPNYKTGELEETTILSDFYLVRDFTDSELRLLVDSLLFSKHIPYSRCKELIEKLEGLSNIYFKSKVKHIRNLPDNSPSNNQLFYTIEMLDEAISKGRQVEFVYNEFGTDKKLYPRKRADGSVRKYIVNPYQMVATNGRYYLVCNYDKYDNVANYRVDKITDIKMIDTSVKPMRSVKELENGLNLPRHMAEHIYMFSGESVRIKFTAKRYIVNEIIDWFGTDVEFSNETPDEVTATVKVNYEAMRCWAMQYARHITIISPQSMADTVKQDILQAAESIFRRYIWMIN